MTTLSIDLRERILAAYDAGEGTREEIATRFRVSLGMVKKLLQQRRTTGDIAPHLNPIEKMWSKIKAFLRKEKARTLDDLTKKLENHSVRFWMMTSWDGLLRAATVLFKPR